MKWLANTLAALADTFEPVNQVASNLIIQPRGLRRCTSALGPNQLAWCDANLHGFKKAREQAEAAWSEPRLPLVDHNVLMRDYVHTAEEAEILNNIKSVIVAAHGATK